MMIFLSLHYGVPEQAQRSGLRGEKEGQQNGADTRRQVGVAEWRLSRRADAEGGLKIRAGFPVLLDFPKIRARNHRNAQKSEHTKIPIDKLIHLIYFEYRLKQ